MQQANPTLTAIFQMSPSTIPTMARIMNGKSVQSPTAALERTRDRDVARTTARTRGLSPTPALSTAQGRGGGHVLAPTPALGRTAGRDLAPTAVLTVGRDRSRPSRSRTGTACSA